MPPIMFIPIAPRQVYHRGAALRDGHRDAFGQLHGLALGIARVDVPRVVPAAGVSVAGQSQIKREAGFADAEAGYGVWS